MQDLSLFLLDLVQNSIRAGAGLVKIDIHENEKRDWLSIDIADDGRGMDDKTIKMVMDPFYTTRTTRKVGLGIPLFVAAVERCQGNVTIESTAGRGTKLKSGFLLRHVDRPPFGRLDSTVTTLIMCNPGIDFVYCHKTDSGIFTLDTREIREIMGEIPLEHPEVIGWIETYIRDGLKEIDGGVS